MQEYLTVTEVVDWQHSNLLQLAQKFSTGDPNTTVKACFEWVRDNIYHSSDYQLNPVTCKASQVLLHKTGYCYAKSHLLAGLLRANAIPTGFCYQRLSIFDNGAPYCLHGFNTVYLEHYGWYRLDARGNKPGIDAQFTLPQERLAYSINFAEEIDYKHIFAEPLPQVVRALRTFSTWDEALHNLPDLDRDYLAVL